MMRIADPRALRRSRRAHGVPMMATFAAEFWDIDRFPAGALCDAAIRCNRAYFKLRLPARPSAGNVILGGRLARSLSR